MRAVAIARANVLRLLRDRSNIFFVFVFPLLLVLLIGAQFGGDFALRVGVHDLDGGAIANSIVATIDEELEVVEFLSSDDLNRAVERGAVTGGLEIPADLAGILEAGGSVELSFLSTADSSGAEIRAVITEAMARAAMIQSAAQFVVETGVGTYEQGEQAATELIESVPVVEVETRTAGESLFPETMGRFDLGASGQLFLFMFLTGLAGSAVLIQTRQLGISTRMLSTPTSIREIVIGEALGRFGVVMVQGLYIMIATLVLFRVDWGDPIGAIAVVVVFAAVAAGAAVLIGSILSNDAQAAGIGVIGGLGLAALGGSMLPIELFSPTMATVARLTPHAWANEAFAELVRRDGTIIDILPQLGVLAAMAAVLLVIAAWRLRVAITRG